MNTKEIILKSIEKAKNSLMNYTVIFLANVIAHTCNRYDYKDSSILTEFLTYEEYNELITALQSFGFYTHVYFNTEDFIKDFYNKKFDNTQLIIFEGTQKGIGRAKDAYIPSFCDLEGLIHTGPNAYVNSICTNKYHWTKLLEIHNISVPRSWQYSNQWLDNEKPAKDILLFAKPCYECASIGIYKESISFYSIEYEKHLKKLSQCYKQPIIVQEFIPGYEIEVPVIIHQNNPYVLPPVAICKNGTQEMGNEILDFDDVYDDNYQFCLLSSINVDMDHEIRKEVSKIVNIIGLEKYTRIDFRINYDGISHVTDINSYPHIVAHSSFAYSFEQLNIDKSNVLPCIIGNVLD